jgi:hypothetical protein
MFSIKNVVTVALMQVGVIVAGILGAGASWKWLKSFSVLPIPMPIAMLMNYGVAGLVIPLIWIMLVLQVRNRPDISEDMKSVAFISGIILLIGLVIGIGYTVLSPWFTVDWHRPQED